MPQAHKMAFYKQPVYKQSATRLLKLLSDFSTDSYEGNRLQIESYDGKRLQ